MISVPELKRWLDTLNPENGVAVDDGGLALIELTRDGDPTGAWCEPGGSEFKAGDGPEEAEELHKWRAELEELSGS